MTASLMILSAQIPQAIVFLACATAGMVLIGAIADRVTFPGSRKRAVWRVTLVGIAAACVFELCGFNSAFTELFDSVWVRPAGPQPIVERELLAVQDGRFTTSLHDWPSSGSVYRQLPADWYDLSPVETESLGDIEEELVLALPGGLDDPSPTRYDATESIDNAAASSRRLETAVWPDPLTHWGFLGLGAIWGCGSATLFVRHIIRSWRLRQISYTMETPTDSDLCLRVEQLARKLRAPNVWLRQGGVEAPMACGVLRPALLLPESFSTDYGRGQQDAVLTHELAHLASADPKWQLLSVCVAALLWWHPLVWFALKKSHLSMEFAADEAAVNVPQGPSHLAECLVALGRQLSPRPRWELGVAGSGFRSALGARVERLLELGGKNSKPSSLCTKAHGACQLSLLLLLFVFVLSAGWALPRHHSFAKKVGGSKMQLLKQNWKNSLAVTLAASLLAPLASAQDSVDDVFVDEVEFVLDDDDDEEVEEFEEDGVSGGDADFAPDSDRKERRVIEERVERRLRTDRTGDDHEVERRERVRPTPRGGQAQMSRAIRQRMTKEIEEIHKRLQSLSERDGTRAEREQLEHELRHLQERLAAEHENSWVRQPGRASQGARQSRRGHIQAAIASLHAAGLHEHAERLAGELRSPRSAEFKPANERQRYQWFGNEGNQKFWPEQDQPRRASNQSVNSPTSQVNNLQKQVESMHEEMSEIRHMLKRLMERAADDRN